MSLFLLYSSRNDCRRRRSEREKVINFRQKEKDILDSIIGMSLIFYPKNHKNIQERKQRELQATTRGFGQPLLTQWQMKQVRWSQKYSIRIPWSVLVLYKPIWWIDDIKLTRSINFRSKCFHHRKCQHLSENHQWHQWLQDGESLVSPSQLTPLLMSK